MRRSHAGAKVANGPSARVREYFVTLPPPSRKRMKEMRAAILVKARAAEVRAKGRR